MTWTKRGLIYEPNGRHWWNKSHAQVPTVDVLDGGRWRIYYSSRDTDNRSRVSFVEVEAGHPGHILYEHDSPIMPLGKLGTFDDSGVMPSWIAQHGQLKYLYYTGWTLGGTVPYHNSVGLAVSSDGGLTFERLYKGPLFGLTHREPYFTGTSCVLIEGGIFRNWYMSCTRWEMIDGRAEPMYHLKYAESSDGVHWKRDGRVAIDYKSPAEAGIARASVLKIGSGYQMWYSYRGTGGYRSGTADSYRIGYAESSDGLCWRRLDERAGIDVSIDGWDSRMIEYPYVLVHGDQLFMFYNGNTFGQTGFGYATAGAAWQKES
jgi:hypothetical protein